MSEILNAPASIVDGSASRLPKLATELCKPVELSQLVLNLVQNTFRFEIDLVQQEHVSETYLHFRLAAAQLFGDVPDINDRDDGVKFDLFGED
jgi:hypothetical protein